jgi:hypothetical protein
VLRIKLLAAHPLISKATNSIYTGDFFRDIKVLMKRIRLLLIFAWSY